MGRSLKILIVEDETIIAMSAQRELQKGGHTVCGKLATGEEAVAAAAEIRPDLILMDISLAGEMDGIAAARAICAVNPIPIIIMTAYSPREIEARLGDFKPLGFVQKPVRIHSLQPLLDKIV